MLNLQHLEANEGQFQLTKSQSVHITVTHPNSTPT